MNLQLEPLSMDPQDSRTEAAARLVYSGIFNYELPPDEGVVGSAVEGMTDEGQVYYGCPDPSNEKNLLAVAALYEPNAGQQYLDVLVVAEPARGCGLGQLVLRGIEEIVHQDYKGQSLRAQSTPSAENFYLRQGYSLVDGDTGEFERWWGAAGPQDSMIS